MAFKGPAYVKTTWTFEERPVASSKLNTWDDRIEAALELLSYLICMTWGGGSGVIRGAATDDLKVTAKSTPGLSVEVQPGYAFINKFPFRLTVATDTVDVTIPAEHDRIDLVQASLDAWSVKVKQGVEAATPQVPAADTDCIPLAQLYLRPGMASIKNSDDGVNGYIVDVRAFL